MYLLTVGKCLSSFCNKRRLYDDDDDDKTNVFYGAVLFSQIQQKVK